MVDDPQQGGEELRHDTPVPKSTFAKREEEILEFWNREKIFEKSLEKHAPRGEFVFYDGPPFANGQPHYGHILAGTIKDAIPRYRTMRGYHVARRWGWDCHGLPVENLVERELGFKGKRDIERYGVAQFNAKARTSIMKDVSDWKRIIPRIGRWVDMERDYKTMDSTYTESVWWAFKRLYDRGLVYEGFKAMHLCPRCGTTLSNFEVAQGYMDIPDMAVTVKLTLLGEERTSLLIWTTTPWTLPGNAAAAVSPDAIYVKVEKDGERYIVAKARCEAVFGESGTVCEEIPGKALVGRQYEPPFPYFKEELHKHKSHAWKVYGAPFVTMEEGTGIVHIAPAFGEDDLTLAQKEKIPLIHHVTEEGLFTATVTDFAHLPVKPKGHHMETDGKIVEYLRAHNLLLKDEKITHSYPHCWRCDTPLLNWAADSWFVAVGKLKKQLLRENGKVGWVPEHVGKGRFANGLQSAPDWAISRSRFWGAPIPVWRHSKTKEVRVAGSVHDVLGMVRRSGNRYFLMRHGQARSNVEDRMESDDTVENRLTEMGRRQVKGAARELRKEQIDLIVTSPLLRAQETAAIVQKTLGLPESAVMTDERIREVVTGIFNGKSRKEWAAFFPTRAARFDMRPPEGEDYADIRRRVGEFLFDLERRYANKNILIVTHGDPGWLLRKIAARKSMEELRQEERQGYLHTGEVVEVPFTPFPHNEEYELDLHRPYIDDLPFGNSIHGEWQRVPGVFDCWFESGAMPFASNHYPFAKQKFNPRRLFGVFPKGYPADFIAEGLDQTRGWFYSLMVLGTALFGRSPYRHVIVNGLILSENGQKMSKRLKNYPDPMEVVERYGADTLRYYLLSSPTLRGDDLRFSLRGVEEVSKKILMRLANVRSFYALYADGTRRHTQSVHVLDRWILARLSELLRMTTDGFERYELDGAARPLAAFVDDLSTWYLRRSRERFKEEGEDKRAALATLRQVLYTLSQGMAPLMPFFAEDLFLAMQEEGDPQSVHLSSWPVVGAEDSALLSSMSRVREYASKALEARERAGIKVRQPLAALSVDTEFSPELQAVLREEVNVKEIRYTAGQEITVMLDTVITPELKEEGIVRDLVRRIQEWRKEQGFTITDRPEHTLLLSPAEADIARKHKEELERITGLQRLEIQSS